MDRLVRGIILGLSWACCIPILGMGQARLSAGNTPPHILLIYVDDLGFGDIGSYGNTLIETPHLDQLAQQGMSFTQAYAPAPLCSPSRAAMLTGKEVARLGFEFVTKYPADDYTWTDPEWIQKFEGLPLVPPPYTLNLPLEEETLAERLKSYGYQTALVGKWHVASHHQVYKGWSLTHGPKQQGFDWTAETFGTHPYSKKEQQGTVSDGQFPKDELTEKSIEFIRQDHASPFFLMSSFYFVHTPLKKNIPWLFEKYREKLPDGASEEQIHYAVNVSLMDHYVGKIVDALKEKGIEKQTLVIFTSDNGGNPEIADNGGFRGSKWNLYEGGIRIPMIISWPGQIRGGVKNTELVSQLDLMATFTELASGSSEGKELDGQSLLPLLMGRSGWKEGRSLVWNFPYYHPEGKEFFDTPATIGVDDGYKSQTRPHAAYRRGPYKLLYFYEDGRKELYDLDQDPSEAEDLSGKFPRIASQMYQELDRHLKDVKARIPTTNPNRK